MSVIYPIGDIFQRSSAIYSDNDGHRRVPAWAVPESEVPLVCSDNEWAAIRKRDLSRLGAHDLLDVPEETPSDLLKPRNRDSSLIRGYVREFRAGSWCERRCSTMVSGGCNIRVLSRMVDFETGEELRPYVRISDTKWNGEELEFDYTAVRFMERHTSRGDNMRSVRETCNKFKWMVRANERNVRLFLTLTYAENMTDTKRLYEDFRRFFPKLQRAMVDRFGRPLVYGYLAACEPQRRGAWHMHILLLSLQKSLYISNKKVCKLWGHGYTKTQRVRNLRDVGVYLTSYLSNIKDGKGTKKGARLALYPVGFRFTRWSRSCALPEKANFYGNFGDMFRDCMAFDLCFDYQDLRRTFDGKKFITRIALYCKEKPK